MRTNRTALRAMLEPGVKALGFELVDTELSGGAGQTVLRVYIDHPRGINVDDCAKVSRQLSAVLDVEDPIAGQYLLEVSSPGLDRPLVMREDFVRFQGETVKVKTYEPIMGRRNFTGRLTAVEGDHVIVEIDNESLDLSLAAIERARLVPKF
jgi:ribosome maturation factor RimP